MLPWHVLTSFAINLVNQYMHRPRVPHLQAVKRIYSYLAETIHHGLLLHRQPCRTLIAYADTDWVECHDTQSVVDCVSISFTVLWLQFLNWLIYQFMLSYLTNVSSKGMMSKLVVFISWETQVCLMHLLFMLAQRLLLPGHASLDKLRQLSILLIAMRLVLRIDSYVL